jgi:hypothetical protein
MEELIPINVVVGDRSYRIKIEQKAEEGQLPGEITAKMNGIEAMLDSTLSK